MQRVLAGTHFHQDGCIFLVRYTHVLNPPVVYLLCMRSQFYSSAGTTVTGLKTQLGQTAVHTSYRPTMRCYEHQSCQQHHRAKYKVQFFVDKSKPHVVHMDRLLDQINRSRLRQSFPFLTSRATS
jgi:hypothetical protein